MGLDSDGSIFRLDLNYAQINTVSDGLQSPVDPGVPGELVISISAAAGHNQSQLSTTTEFLQSKHGNC